jgi:hypothetical protein
MAEIKTKIVNLNDIKINPDNPRRISAKDMDRLVKSLHDFPDMMGIREIVVDETMTVLGGNMRLLALRKSGANEATVKIVSGLTPEQKREFVVKDNATFGEWDFDLLANEWADLPLDDWGLDLPEEWLKDPEDEPPDETYTSKIVSPIYEPKGERPPLSALIDRGKTEELIAGIDAAGLPSDVATFLKFAAERHTVFNFRQIAEYYCHADKTIQELMEQSGMVIIDFKKAIEYGFVHLTERLGAIADIEEGENDA